MAGERNPTAVGPAHAATQEAALAPLAPVQPPPELTGERPEELPIETEPWTAEYEEYLAITRRRRSAGYALGTFAIGLILTIGGLSLWGIHEWTAPVDPSHDKFELFRLGAHGVISIALIFFCYQLLRVAERFVLPYWWAEKNADIAKVMLGVEDPLSAAAKLVDRVSRFQSHDKD